MLEARVGATTPTFEHPVLRRIKAKEAALRNTVNHAFESEPRWLRLPVTRREVALERLSVISDFEASGAGGVEKSAEAAKRLGISQRQFYLLLNAWRQNRSVYSLVPWANRITAKRSKLAPDVARLLGHTIVEAIRTDQTRTSRTILRHVLDSWPLGQGERPSEQTIRAHISLHLQADIGVGPFRLNASEEAQETAEKANHYGEVIIIDHIAPDIFVADGENAYRPTLTLAIDLFTKTVVGFSIGRGDPNPTGIFAALQDAENRSVSSAGGATVKPRLVLATTGGQPWRDLVRVLAQSELEVAIRWSPRLHYGGPARRLLGPKLGEIPLLSRKTHDHFGGRFDPKKHALVTCNEASIVIADAVHSAACFRLKPNIQLAGLCFDLAI